MVFAKGRNKQLFHPGIKAHLQKYIFTHESYGNHNYERKNVLYFYPKADKEEKDWRFF